MVDITKRGMREVSLYSWIEISRNRESGIIERLSCNTSLALRLGLTSDSSLEEFVIEVSPKGEDQYFYGSAFKHAVRTVFPLTVVER